MLETVDRSELVAVQTPQGFPRHALDSAYAAATTERAGRETGDWERAARAAFVDAYRTAAAGAAFLPASSEAFQRAVAALELEKAAYEIVYEANNRPDWLEIPVRGFVNATAALARAAGAA